MPKCDRCGMGTRPFHVWSRTNREITLCSACNAEFEEWIEQDGLYTPLWREDDDE